MTKILVEIGAEPGAVECGACCLLTDASPDEYFYSPWCGCFDKEPKRVPKTRENTGRRLRLPECIQAEKEVKTASDGLTEAYMLGRYEAKDKP